MCDRTSEFRDLCTDKTPGTSGGGLSIRHRKGQRPRPADETGNTVAQRKRPEFLQNALSLARELLELQELVVLQHAQLVSKPAALLESSFDGSFSTALVLSHARLVAVKELQDAEGAHDASQKSRWQGWFGSGEESQRILHYELIVSYLRRRHAVVSEQFEMLRGLSAKRVEARRQLGLRKQAVHMRSARVASAWQDERREEKPSFSETQMHVLQQSNDALVQEINAMSEELDATEVHMVEIARLQTVLQENLLMQRETSERLYDEAGTALETVRKGNMYIGKAAKHQSSFRTIMVSLILIAALFLLLLHWYSD